MPGERKNLLFPDDEDQEVSLRLADRRTGTLHPPRPGSRADPDPYGGGERAALPPAARRPRPAPAPAPVPRRSAGPSWLFGYLLALITLDALALLIGGVFGRLVRFGDLDGGAPVFAITLPAWLLTLAASRAYEPRVVGLGSEEFRRVANAAARFTAVIAIGVFVFRWDVARGLVALTLPSSAVLALLFRFLARKVLHAARRWSGAASHRVLVVGDGGARDALVAKLKGTTHHGLRVVGTCEPTRGDDPGNASVLHIRRIATTIRADTLAVAHSASVSPQTLRRISWVLEGTGIDLLVAPALTDVAGPRIHVRPVPGLPLLQIAEPEFRGPRRLAKAAIDLIGSALLLTLASPLLLIIALAVRAGGPGPVLFRQTRIGRNGHPFTMYKFRSMHQDAELRLAELMLRNDHADGILFKLRDDPRITPIGRYLRRYSLDELPQLLNVLRGQMSLVGPRPPLPSEVARYAQDVHRRLLVKPGLTGLWQVSGRSDLNWDETVRLDLYYVENWSAALDAEILWKTLSAVLRGHGAR